MLCVAAPAKPRRKAGRRLDDEITFAPAASAPSTTTAVGYVAVQVSAVGFDLYLDALEDGIAAQRLEVYAEELCQALCDQYKAADVRCAPEPLSFGKWRGALAALAAAQLPPPGAYVCSSNNEVTMVVFEALRSKARRVVRGVK